MSGDNKTFFLQCKLSGNKFEVDSWLDRINKIQHCNGMELTKLTTYLLQRGVQVVETELADTGKLDKQSYAISQERDRLAKEKRLAELDHLSELKVSK